MIEQKNTIIKEKLEDVSLDRDKYIGGSDVSTILGINSFKTRQTLLKEKAGLIDIDFKGNEYTKYGNIMEPKIREFISKKFNQEFKEYQAINDYIRYNDDGVSNDYVLEIKTTSKLHNGVNNYDYYLCQLLLGMFMHSKDKGILAVYERPKDFDTYFNPLYLQIFEIEMRDHAPFMVKILEECDKFINDLESLKKGETSKEENALLNIVNEISTLENSLAQLKRIEKNIKEKKLELKQAMQDNNIKKWEMPNGTKLALIDDKEDTTEIKKVFKEDIFLTEHQELHDKYEEAKKPYYFDEDYTKKGRKGYVRITLPKKNAQ